MMLPLRAFRGLYKPTGMPRLDPARAPRGLRQCYPFADPSFANVGPVGRPSPSAYGSLIQWAPTAFGPGCRFSGASLTNNELGYQVDNIGTVSLEVLFVTGSTIAGEAIAGWNDQANGQSSTRDKDLYFNASSQLTWYYFGGAPQIVVDSTTTYAANTLYHVVGTFDVPSTAAALYVNGVSVGSNTGGGSFTGYTTPTIAFGSSTTGQVGLEASNITVLYGSYANVPWTAAEVAARYADPYAYLIFPDDDIFAELVGLVAATSLPCGAIMM